MFWTLIILSGLALLFVKLGMLTVTVKVLGFALHFTVVAIFVMLIHLLWRKLFGSRNDQRGISER